MKGSKTRTAFGPGHPGHGRIVCACGRVVMTCRCPDSAKVIATVEKCEGCKNEKPPQPLVDPSGE